MICDLDSCCTCSVVGTILLSADSQECWSVPNMMAKQHAQIGAVRHLERRRDLRITKPCVLVSNLLIYGGPSAENIMVKIRIAAMTTRSFSSPRSSKSHFSRVSYHYLPRYDRLTLFVTDLASSLTASTPFTSRHSTSSSSTAIAKDGPSSKTSSSVDSPRCSLEPRKISN